MAKAKRPSKTESGTNPNPNDRVIPQYSLRIHDGTLTIDCDSQSAIAVFDFEGGDMQSFDTARAAAEAALAAYRAAAEGGVA